jgi:pyruvate dehydrogenase E1 component
MVLLQAGPARSHRVQLLGDGAIMDEVLRAAALLEQHHGIAADVWRITSYEELSREGVEREREWRHGTRAAIDSGFERCLAATSGPIIASTDHPRSVPEMVRAFIPPGRRYLTLGTEPGTPGGSLAECRAFAEVDAAAIVQASLRAVDEIVCAERITEQRRLADVLSLSSV